MFIIPYVIFCAQFNQNNIQCKTINRVAKLFTGTYQVSTQIGCKELPDLLNVSWHSVILSYIMPTLV